MLMLNWSLFFESRSLIFWKSEFVFIENQSLFFENQSLFLTFALVSAHLKATVSTKTADSLLVKINNYMFNKQVYEILKS